MLIRRAAFHSLGVNICRHQLNCHLNSTQDGRVTCDGADEAEEPVTLEVKREEEERSDGGRWCPGLLQVTARPC